MSWARLQKKYILETDGSESGSSTNDNGRLARHLPRQRSTRCDERNKVAPHAALFTTTTMAHSLMWLRRLGVINDRWGFGVAIGDYDNDDWPGHCCLQLRQDRLFHTTTMARSPTWAKTPGVTLATGATAPPGVIRRRWAA